MTRPTRFLMVRHRAPALAAALLLASGLALAQSATPAADHHAGHGGHAASHAAGGHGGHGEHGAAGTGHGGGSGGHGGGKHGGGKHGGGGMGGGGMHGGGGSGGGGGMHGGGMHDGGLGGASYLGRVFEHSLRDAKPSEDQQRQIDRVVEAARKKNWPLFDQVLEERARLQALHATQPRDLKAIKAAYRKLSDLQVRIAENRLDAFDEVARLLNAEQRKAFETHTARHFSH